MHDHLHLSRVAILYIIFTNWADVVVLLPVLLIALSKPAINEVFLVLVSYAIIFTFFLIEVCLALTSFPR